MSLTVVKVSRCRGLSSSSQLRLGQLQAMEALSTLEPSKKA